MNFALENGAGALDDAVECGSHPADHWMANPGLDLLDDGPARFLVPAPVYRLRGHPKLDEEVVRVIGSLRLAPLFLPKAQKGSLVSAHDDPGI
jgi:hypothetical protein